MSMTQARWNSLTKAERAKYQDVSALTPELIGLEGWRVEATFEGFDKPERFIVGQSTGWMPVHIMRKRRDSSGGCAVWPKLISVRKLYKVQS